MSIGIGAVLKLMKGGPGPDEIAETLAAMGVEASFVRLGPGQVREEFEALWFTASADSASVMRLEVTMKNGERLTGLLALNQPGNAKVTGEANFELDSRGYSDRVRP